MKTAFCGIALDQIRYSLVWEGHQALRTALNLTADDHALVITSAGCNVLNTLLTAPRRVTAIDVNPFQNRLLQFKVHIIREHPYAVYRGVLGLDGPAAVTDAVTKVLPTLRPPDRAFWEAFFETHPEGLLLAGRLEQYLHGFYDVLPPKFQQALVELTRCESVEAQTSFFDEILDVPAFSDRFVRYFNNRNLSQGRDPKLYAYTPERGGEVFYHRLKAFVRQHPVRDNFHFQFFFFGLRLVEDAVLPPCYREENYGALRAALPKLEVVTAEAVSYLLSEAGASVTKAGLSNIFEYTSPSDFRESMEELASRAGKSQAGRPPAGQPLRLAFWNLLNDQGQERYFDQWRDGEQSALLTEQETCFYFGSIRVFSMS